MTRWKVDYVRGGYLVIPPSQVEAACTEGFDGMSELVTRVPLNPNPNPNRNPSPSPNPNQDALQGYRVPLKEVFERMAKPDATSKRPVLSVTLFCQELFDRKVSLV